MLLKDIAALPGCRTLTAADMERPVTDAYASDMLSAAMAKAGPGCIWITIQAHSTILGVASIKELAAVLLAEGALPDMEVLAVAARENITLFSSPETAFELSGRIYKLLNNGD